MATIKHLRKVLTPPASKSHSNLKTTTIIKAIKKVDKKYEKMVSHKHFLHPSHA